MQYAPQKGAVVSTEDNKRVVATFVEVCQNQHNLEFADQIFHPEMVDHYAQDGRPAARRSTAEHFKQFYGMLLQAFPDASMEIKEQLAERDLVATRKVLRGTHRGELAPGSLTVPPKFGPPWASYQGEIFLRGMAGRRPGPPLAGPSWRPRRERAAEPRARPTSPAGPDRGHDARQRGGVSPLADRAADAARRLRARPVGDRARHPLPAPVGLAPSGFRRSSTPRASRRRAGGRGARAADDRQHDVRDTIEQIAALGTARSGFSSTGRRTASSPPVSSTAPRPPATARSWSRSTPSCPAGSRATCSARGSRSSRGPGSPTISPTRSSGRGWQAPRGGPPGGDGRVRGLFPNPRLTWERPRVPAQSTTLPIALKGILHPDDARLAREHGIDAVVVSNHGGRQVDGAIASLDALPAIVDAVGGDLDVLLDSGVRSGADVVKALALGADAVLLGRPYIWGLAVDGEAGVLAVLRAILAELDLTVGLSWHTPGPAELSPDAAGARERCLGKPGGTARTRWVCEGSIPPTDLTVQHHFRLATESIHFLPREVEAMEMTVAARSARRSAVLLFVARCLRHVRQSRARSPGRESDAPPLPVHGPSVSLGCADARSALGGAVASGGRCSPRQAGRPRVHGRPDRPRARPDPVGLQAEPGSMPPAGRSRSSTPRTIPTRPRTSPRSVRRTACRRARRPTAASRRSTRTAPPARCRRATTAGPRRRASTSTRSRRPARPATSCWWRPARPTPRPGHGREQRGQGGRRGGHLQQLRRLGGLLGDLHRQRLQPPGRRHHRQLGRPGYGVEYPAASRVRHRGRRHHADPGVELARLDGDARGRAPAAAARRTSPSRPGSTTPAAPSAPSPTCPPTPIPTPASACTTRTTAAARAARLRRADRSGASSRASTAGPRWAARA